MIPAREPPPPVGLVNPPQGSVRSSAANTAHAGYQLRRLPPSALYLPRCVRSRLRLLGPAFRVRLPLLARLPPLLAGGTLTTGRWLPICDDTCPSPPTRPRCALRWVRRSPCPLLFGSGARACSGPQLLGGHGLPACHLMLRVCVCAPCVLAWLVCASVCKYTFSTPSLSPRGVGSWVVLGAIAGIP